MRITYNRNRKDVIDYVNKDIGVSKADMRIIYSSIERAVVHILSEATEEEPIQLRLFAGLYLIAERVPPRIERDPRTGKSVMSRERINTRLKTLKSFQWSVQEEAGLFHGYDRKDKRNEDEDDYDDEEE